ncbi:hypothetical protein J6590_001367 [Homalodisca vitripennis]|nr:hypothetical protein J6590_001367 [Homalodisca vitripennis]
MSQSRWDRVVDQSAVLLYHYFDYCSPRRDYSLFTVDHSLPLFSLMYLMSITDAIPYNPILKPLSIILPTLQGLLHPGLQVIRGPFHKSFSPFCQENRQERKRYRSLPVEEASCLRQFTGAPHETALG